MIPPGPQRPDSLRYSGQPRRAIPPPRCGRLRRPAGRFLSASFLLAVLFGAASAWPVWSQAQRETPGGPPPNGPAANAAFSNGIAIFPFRDRRDASGSDWLGAYLREGIADTLRREGSLPVMSGETARLWAVRFGNDLDATLPEEAHRTMGVSAVVRAETQRVVDQARVRLQWIPADPDAGAGESWEFHLDLARQSPRQALERVMEPLLARLLPAPTPVPPPQPESWKSVAAYYDALRVPGGAGASALAVALAEAQGDSALRGRALAALAEGKLQEAMAESTPAAARQSLLREALRMAKEAARLEPWHSRRLALKGEIHYFRKEDYEAKTEASVARLKNPADGLAYAVLALTAGLSTAEGGQWMRLALKADPFLQAAARPEGEPPFQGGALEAALAKWERLQSGREAWANPEFERQMELAQALFEQGRWDEAEAALFTAGELEPDSHRPRLLLSSIWLESRDPEGAVTELRLLAAEFPQEWEVWQALGIALEVMEQYPDAEQAFLKALAERSEEPQSLFHLALAQMGQTHWETAQATLRRLLQRDESHGQGWLHLGVVETRLERWNDAARAFEQAMQLNPESEKARAGLSLAQSKLSR